MWEFIAFVLFGWSIFVVGGAFAVGSWRARAVVSGRFEHLGGWYRVTKIEE